MQENTGGLTAEAGGCRAGDPSRVTAVFSETRLHQLHVLSVYAAAREGVASAKWRR